MTTEVYQILQKFWGFTEFRQPQQAIIENILLKNDTIALLPTGGGKSLCYQLPAIVFSGKTIVITPLIALMEDQVQSLRVKGIKAAAIHSNLSYRELDRTLDNFVFGDIKILFISPERIHTEIFKERYKRTNVDLIAVDEAHCISQWGYDFRPSYLSISALREWKPEIAILALTATATTEVLNDIQKNLQLKSPVIYRKSYFRENIGFFCLESSDKKGELLNVLRQSSASGIIYVRNRGETIDISSWLRNHGISALPYHGGMEYVKRQKHQEAWMKNEVQIVVCTNAFGMGIDKPDVRFVVHLDIPASLEEYFQEAGRAGRDGKLSRAFLFYENADVENSKSRWSEQFPDIESIGNLLDELYRYKKVAYGSGPGESFTFRLNEFAHHVKTPGKMVFQILQILAKEGWIELSDGLMDPTRVMITIDRQALFEPGFLDEVSDRILIQLLRKYEGVFSMPVKIDEEVISRELGMEEQTLIEYLTNLERKEILSIQWKKNEPHITFLQERPQPSEFSMDKVRYRTLAKNAGKRLDAMLEFLLDEKRCRQKVLLEYFGEKIEPCGHCDFCLIQELSETEVSIIHKILEHLRSSRAMMKSVFIKELFFQYPIIYRSVIKRALVKMTNEKIINIHPSGLIQLV